MIAIARDLPFFDRETTIAVPSGQISIRPFQIVVWVSISAQHIKDLSASAPRFPAVLDTGNNHNFSLRETQFFTWAGAKQQDHFERARVTIANETIPLLSANIWLHRNQTGERDVFGRGKPFCLELPEGIAVYPPQSLHAVRLPTLGLRGLVGNGLRLVVDGRKLRVSLFALGKTT